MDRRRDTIVYINRNHYSRKRKWKKGRHADGESTVSGRGQTSGARSLRSYGVD